MMQCLQKQQLNVNVEIKDASHDMPCLVRQVQQLVASYSLSQPVVISCFDWETLKTMLVRGFRKHDPRLSFFGLQTSPW